MKSAVKVLACLSVLIFLVSCSTTTWERKGDAAYNSAKNLSGDQKRIKIKTAYIMYQKAIAAHPEKVSLKLRTRFIELTLDRAKMVIDEGSSNMDAIPIYERDIESMFNQEIPADLKQQYALFLAQTADSSIARDQVDRALGILENALQFAGDPAPIIEKRNSLVGRVAKENLDEAQMDYTDAKAGKDADEMVKAEYHALVAILVDSTYKIFDSTYNQTVKLLSDVRKENQGTYSAYLKVIDQIPDSAIFRKVNKYDILLAVPTFTGTSAVVNIYNYSYNPLRLKSEQFYLVDVKGKKYQAAAGAKVDPDILDQEHETKINLKFPKAEAQIDKLIYQNEDHYSEKQLM